MKEITIAFITFFMFFFLVILIRVSRQLRRRKNTNRKMPGLILFSKIRRSKTADFDCDCGGADCGGDCGGGDCDCGGGDCGGSDCDCGGADCGGDCGGGDCDCGGGDCGGSDCDCGGCDCPSGGSGCDSGCCECLACLAYTSGEGPCNTYEPRRERMSEADKSQERQFVQRTKMDMKTYQAVMAKEEDKIKALVDEKGKASIWWLSFTGKIPKEMVIEIFEKDPGYVIRNDYVYTLEQSSIEEELEISERKIKEGICEFCKNPYETEMQYCPNCGASIEIAEEQLAPIVSIHEEQEETQAYYSVSSPVVAEKPINKYENLPYASLIAALITIIVFFIPIVATFMQIASGALAIIFGTVGLFGKKKRGLSIFGIIVGIIGIVFWLLMILDIFYLWYFF